MRVRTEDKRQEIIAVAGELFQEQGYDRTSMSLISQRLGGSKATLYGYFRSKEELLLAVLDFDIDSQSDELMGSLLGAPDLATGLRLLGGGYLARRLSIRPTRFYRIVSSLPESMGVGRAFYERILKAAWMRLCRRFEMLMEEGRLRRADPWTAVMHFKGMLDQDLIEQRQLGVIDGLDAKTVERVATDAVDIFLRAYGPDAAVAEASTPKRKRAPLTRVKG